MKQGTGQQKRHLRTLAHGLSPVVTVGKAGITKAVICALHQALDDHELIKVRFADEDRNTRTLTINDLCNRTNATFIQSIGRIAVLFRASEKRGRDLL